MRALELVHDWPVGRVAAGWITASGLTGVSGDADLAFALASVTKPLFAIAVLVAIEEGTLHLDQPAGPPGATIRHLLAHASGLGPEGEEPLAPPGVRRIYSNSGFEVLGRALDQASGMDHRQYFQEAVVEPLGLGATRLEGSPAHGARSSVPDLLTVAGELFAPTLVSPATIGEATTAQFPQLSGILPGFGRHEPNPWGLGFEIRGHKHPHWTGTHNSPRTYGHFGRSGTMLWLDPVAGSACVALTDTAFGTWARKAWPVFSDAVLSETSAP